MDVRFGEESPPLEFLRANSLAIHADLTQRSVLQSDFDFARVWTTGTVGVPTFSRSLLFPQMIWLRLSAGVSGKETPTQYLFDLESASSNYAPFGVFKAMDVKEFSGTSFVALGVEHNFGSVPFLALGIPFLYENNIEFILHAGVAQAWSEATYYATTLPATANLLLPSILGNPTHGWYSEVGFGFSKIFDVLRADFTWRLRAPTRFHFTLGVANLF
jgi:hypothetical protein